MNKILTTLIGTSLLTGALYAGQHTSMNNSKGCKAHSQSNNSMNSKSSMSKSTIQAFEDSFQEDDLQAGG